MAEYIGTALEVGGEEFAASANARTRLRNFAALAASMRPYLGELAATTLATVLKHVATLGAAFTVSYMAGRAMDGTLQGGFGPLVALLCALVALRVAAFYGEMWWGHDVAYKVLRDFRVRLFAQIDRLSPGFLLRHHSGRLAATLMADVELLEWFLAHTLANYVAVGVVTLATVALLCALSPLLGGLLALFCALAAATPFVMARRADAQGRVARERLAEANKVTVEGVQGMREIVALGASARYKERNRAAMEGLYAAQRAYGSREGVEGALLTLFVGAFAVCSMLVAASLVAQGRLDAALYPAVVVVSSMAFGPIVEVCGVARNLGNVVAAADRIQRVLDEKPAVEDPAEPVAVPAAWRARGAAGAGEDAPGVVFEHVSFRYAPDLPLALDDVSFTIEPGQTVALVGASGAGKSTCANMLLRYADPEAGRVLVGGVDVRAMALDDLHATVSAVLQDVYLFNASVRENIRLGDPLASDAAVARAARAACVDEFAAQLPHGYDTLVGERGALLSGGQRQRVSIARAVLKGSPVLILDEAVSSLDVHNERAVQRTLGGQAQGRTTLVIAHRLSTIVAADRVVFVRGGRVEASGTHDELLRSCPAYRALLASQLG